MLAICRHMPQPASGDAVLLITLVRVNFACTTYWLLLRPPVVYLMANSWKRDSKLKVGKLTFKADGAIGNPFGLTYMVHPPAHLSLPPHFHLHVIQARFPFIFRLLHLCAVHACVSVLLLHIVVVRAR